MSASFKERFKFLTGYIVTGLLYGYNYLKHDLFGIPRQ